MNLNQVRKAAVLIKDFICGSDTIVLDDGGLALHVYLKDDRQKVFKEIEDVINWLQVQKFNDELANHQ